MTNKVVGALIGVGLVAMSIGCGPRVRLTVLDAPDIQLPADIRRVAIATDGSPEAEAARAGLATRLTSSPRIHLVAAASEADATITVRPLHARTTLTDEAAGEEWSATRTGEIGIGWALTDRRGETVDALQGVVVVDSWTETGADAQRARAEVVGDEAATRALYWSAGAAYARRIAPMEDDIVRTIATGAHPQLREAHLAVLGGDWDRAIRSWRAVGPSAAPGVRARAAYDLAVAYEVRGEYRRALAELERALAIRSAPRWVRYRRALEATIAEQRMLRRAVVQQEVP